MIPKLRIMGRQVVHITQRPRRGRALGLATAILAALALAPASAPAEQSGPPMIESVGSGVGGEVTLSAHINPDGLETSYEIGLECSPCGPGDQWAKGALPAVDESRTVTLTLTGVQPGRHWFAVRASNTDGETSQRSDILEIPSSPAPFPEGTAPNHIVEAPYLGAATEQLKKIAEQEAERRTKAKEQEEQKARELNARLPSELQHTEEQAPAHTQTEHPACHVPALKGDTLAVARRALTNSHCQLGKVHRRSHHHSTLRVTHQSAPNGKKLPVGAAVAVTLAPR